MLAFLLFCFSLMAWLTPKTDSSFYVNGRARDGSGGRESGGGGTSQKKQSFIEGLLTKGKNTSDMKKKADEERAKKVVKINYFSTQVVDVKDLKKPLIKSGAKLIGFLIDPIDSRSPTEVRVTLPYGGEASKITIPRNSILFGQFAYPGEGDRVSVQFTKVRLESGGEKKISGIALDAKTFTQGLVGELISNKTLKLAANVGLSMVSGMADVLTDKEALASGAGGGVSLNDIQAKPTMKNALIQGAGHAAQSELNDTSSIISNERDYITIAAGRELIIQLTEDFRE